MKQLRPIYSFALFIQKEREDKGLSIQELSELSGIEVERLENMEAGMVHTTSKETITKWAKALNLNPVIVFDRLLSCRHAHKAANELIN